jgi:hypothetical protein
MAIPSRRLILRVSTKLFGLTALLVTGYVLLTSGDNEEAIIAPAITPLIVDLNNLPPAVPHRLEWAGGTLQLLRMSTNEPPYLFYDRGGNLNCPLRWQPPGTSPAPQQPWAGGFSDQCSSVWYHYDGQIVAGQGSSRGLQTVPYQLRDGYLLVTGASGDNASPAN